MENIKIVVIDNHDSFVYNLIEIIRKLPFCTYEVIKSDQIDLNYIKSFDRILISPGPGVPSDNLLLIETIKRFCCTHSILGVCLGHQALAVALGGDIQQMATPKHGHISVLQQVDRTNLLFKEIDSNIEVGRYHSWVVLPEKMPHDFYVTSMDEEGNIMSMSHTTLPLYGVQFHPESIMSPLGEKMITNWIIGDKSVIE